MDQPLPRAGQVQLEWALVEEAGGGRQLHHVDDFGFMARGARPRAWCEACDGEVRFHLGPLVAHHFAHRTESRCPLSQGETAEHYNTVRWLAGWLQRVSPPRLWVSERCSVPNRYCSLSTPRVIAEGWDEVRVERLMHPVRPDITLLRDGVAAGAVEVCLTHAVTPEKADALAALGVPWIEVEAGIERSDRRLWERRGGPVPRRGYGPPQPWICPGHAESAASPGTAEARGRGPVARSEYLNHPGDWEWKVRLFDVYPKEGVRTRRMMWMLLTVGSDRAAYLRLCDSRKDREITSIRVVDGDVGAAEEALHRQMKDSFRYWTRHHGAIYDSPMHWCEPRDLLPHRQLSDAFSVDLYPPRYRRLAGDGPWAADEAQNGKLWIPEGQRRRQEAAADTPGPAPQEDLFGAAPATHRPRPQDVNPLLR